MKTTKYPPGGLSLPGFPGWLDLYDAIIRPYIPNMPEHVISLELKISLDEIPTIMVEFIPQLTDVDENGEQIIVKQQFQIVPIASDPVIQ